MENNGNIIQNAQNGDAPLGEKTSAVANEEISQPIAEDNSASQYISNKEILEEEASTKEQEGETDMGEKNEDTPNEQNSPAYEAEDWQIKVEEFFKKYPVAKGFASMIGEQIVNDESLSRDGNCLEKALARVFDKVYVPPEELVKNENFLDKYVYKIGRAHV